jgi:hypothetical protein
LSPITKNAAAILTVLYSFAWDSDTVGWGTVLQAGMSWVWFPMVALEFFIDIILPGTLWLWGWLSLWRNEYLGGKSSWCVGLTTLPPSCADCLEIWEPQSPALACNGIPLPLWGLITREHVKMKEYSPSVYLLCSSTYIYI